MCLFDCWFLKGYDLFDLVVVQKRLFPVTNIDLSTCPFVCLVCIQKY